MRKVQPTDKTIPCLICEKEISMELYPDSDLHEIARCPFDRGAECRSPGNYGSQVHDMNGQLHFVLCDGCIIRHSAKMLLMDHGEVQNGRDYYDQWWSGILANHERENPGDRLGVGDSYIKDVGPYFQDPE